MKLKNKEKLIVQLKDIQNFKHPFYILNNNRVIEMIQPKTGEKYGF